MIKIKRNIKIGSLLFIITFISRYINYTFDPIWIDSIRYLNSDTLLLKNHLLYSLLIKLGSIFFNKLYFTCFIDLFFISGFIFFLYLLSQRYMKPIYGVILCLLYFLRQVIFNFPS